jgi:cell wall-associated NlpC family hydrolase
MSPIRILPFALLGILLAGCGHWRSSPMSADLPAQPVAADRLAATSPLPPQAHEVVMFALGLIDTGYRYGGKNPAAGLDCSGMVSHVFSQAAELSLQGSAADIAQQGRPIDRSQMRPGDLVFFNTLGRSYSHVGIYIGNERFIHAPNSNGRVRTESLAQGWFASRFEEARTYFD